MFFKKRFYDIIFYKRRIKMYKASDIANWFILKSKNIYDQQGGEELTLLK